MQIEEVKKFLNRLTWSYVDLFMSVVILFTLLSMTVLAPIYENSNLVKALFITNIIVSIVLMIVFDIKKPKELQEEKVAKSHFRKYNKIMKKLTPFFESLKEEEIDLVSIKLSDDYDKDVTGKNIPFFEIEYRKHGTIKKIITNNLVILDTEAKENRLRAKVIPIDCVFGAMQYDLYDIKVALTKETTDLK